MFAALCVICCAMPFCVQPSTLLLHLIAPYLPESRRCRQSVSNLTADLGMGLSLPLLRLCLTGRHRQLLTLYDVCMVFASGRFHDVCMMFG